MKFETILEAFEGVIEGMERTDYLGDDWLCDKHTRQRDAFRARLAAMYAEAYSKWQAGSELIGRVRNVIDGWE